jgi:hypothetical protein
MWFLRLPQFAVGLLEWEVGLARLAGERGGKKAMKRFQISLGDVNAKRQVAIPQRVEVNDGQTLMARFRFLVPRILVWVIDIPLEDGETRR